MTRTWSRTAMACVLLLACSASGRTLPGTDYFLSQIRDARGFASLAGHPYGPDLGPEPALLFAVDLVEKPAVYFIDSRSYSQQSDFLADRHLSAESGNTLRWNTAYAQHPRFECGVIVDLGPKGGYVVHWWNNTEPEHPQASAETQKAALGLLKTAFFAPLHVASSSSGAPRRASGVNDGMVVGRLRILDDFERDSAVQAGDILALRRFPVHVVPSAAGLILAGRPSPLAHFIILAHSLGMPVLAGYGDLQPLQPLQGRWVSLSVQGDRFEVRAATPAEIAQAQAAKAPSKPARQLPADLEWKQVSSLEDIRGVDWVRFGAKAANLGELVHAGDPKIVVPRGFAVPFYYYGLFVRDNGLDLEMQRILRDSVLRSDRAKRSLALAALRAKFEAGKLSPGLEAEVRARLVKDYAGIGVFVRSSSNFEDLPGFSAAGVFSTVPNARGADKVLEGIKKVWASTWNDEAFDARERAGVSQTSNLMGVLIQQGIDADAAGVALTQNPRDLQEQGVVFIAAKKGLGIRVVDGHALPEQYLYRADKGVTLLNRSGDQTRLNFDAGGGVQAAKVAAGAPVLSSAFVETLGQAAFKIRDIFGMPEDIEWVAQGGKLMIVQARPYYGPSAKD